MVDTCLVNMGNDKLDHFLIPINMLIVIIKVFVLNIDRSNSFQNWDFGVQQKRTVSSFSFLFIF